jgi:hypothetical protein
MHSLLLSSDADKIYVLWSTQNIQRAALRFECNNDDDINCISILMHSNEPYVCTV